ncbi:MAG: hypothetical protein QXY39_03740 [Thermofilaceae archaeon]
MSEEYDNRKEGFENKTVKSSENDKRGKQQSRDIDLSHIDEKVSEKILIDKIQQLSSAIENLSKTQKEHADKIETITNRFDDINKNINRMSLSMAMNIAKATGDFDMIISALGRHYDTLMKIRDKSEFEKLAEKLGVSAKELENLRNLFEQRQQERKYFGGIKYHPRSEELEFLMSRIIGVINQGKEELGMSFDELIQIFFKNKLKLDASLGDMSKKISEAGNKIEEMTRINIMEVTRAALESMIGKTKSMGGMKLIGRADDKYDELKRLIATELALKVDAVLKMLGSQRSLFGLKTEEIATAILIASKTPIGKFLSEFGEVGMVEISGFEFFAKPMRELKSEITRLAFSYMYSSTLQKWFIERQIGYLRDLYMAVGFLGKIFYEGVSVKEFKEFIRMYDRSSKIIQRVLGKDIIEKLMEKPETEKIGRSELSRLNEKVYINLLKLITETSRITQKSSEYSKILDKLGGVFTRTRRFGEDMVGVFNRIKSSAQDLASGFIYMIPGLGYFLAIVSAVSGALETLKRSFTTLGSIIMPIISFIWRRTGLGRFIENRVLNRMGGVVERIYRFFNKEGEENKGFRQKLLSILKMILTGVIIGKMISGLKNLFTGGMIGGILTGVGMKGAIGGVIMGMGMTMKGMIGGIIAGIGKTIGGVLTGAGGIALGVIGGITLIGKLGEAIGITEQGLRNLGDKFEKQGSIIGKAGMEFSANLWAMGDLAKQWLTENVPIIGGALGELGQGLIHGGAMIIMGFSALGGFIEIGAKGIYNKVIEFGDRIMDGAKWIREQISNAWNGFTNWVRENIFTPIRKSFEGFENWVNINIYNRLRDAFLGAKNWVENNIFTPLSAIFNGIGIWIYSNVISIFEGFVNIGKKILEKLGIDPNKFIGNLNNAINDAGNIVKDFAKNILGSLSSSLGYLMNLFGGNPTGLAGSVYYVDQAMRGLLQSINNMHNGIDMINMGLWNNKRESNNGEIVEAINMLRSDMINILRELIRTRPQVNINVEGWRSVRYG